MAGLQETSDDEKHESNAIDPPSEHSVILGFDTNQPQTAHDTVARDRGPACAPNGPDVPIGALRRTLHACLEGVQRVASVRAGIHSVVAPRSSENVLTQSSEGLRVALIGHATCSYVESDMRFMPSRSPRNEEMRGRVSPLVSSTPSGVPGLRDLARFEWKIR